MTEREALKLALEAFRKIQRINWNDGLEGLDKPTDFAERQSAIFALGDAKIYALKAIEDIELLLQQPEQEPVAHTAIFHCPNCEYPHRQVTHITGVAQPPWLPQRTWVGLTDEDRAFCVQATVDSGDAVQLMCAVEAKLKEKNT